MKNIKYYIFNTQYSDDTLFLYKDEDESVSVYMGSKSNEEKPYWYGLDWDEGKRANYLKKLLKEIKEEELPFLMDKVV